MFRVVSRDLLGKLLFQSLLFCNVDSENENSFDFTIFYVWNVYGSDIARFTCTW